jgi:ClpP class serine protease
MTLDVLWFMEENQLHGYLDTLLNTPQESIDKIETAMQNGSYVVQEEDNPVLAGIDGPVVTLLIQGTLTKSRAPRWLSFFGIKTTSYVDIIAAVEKVKDTPGVELVKVKFDTPGGTASGIDQTYQAILDLATSMEVEAEISGMCASGGYYLASAIPKITATGFADEIGSIGVLVVYTSWKKFDEKMGLREIYITSSNAPNKAPDPETKGGRQVIQDRVDALERVFYKRISEGRGVSTEYIAENFGRGGVLIAYDPDPDRNDAVSVGMIDAVLGVDTAIKIKTDKEIKTMATLAELMASDPALNAEVKERDTDMMNRGRQAGIDSIKAKIDKAVPYLNSEYPEPIRSLATKVISGSEELASLVGAVTFYDIQKEKDAKAAAEEETTDQKETPPEANTTVENGTGEVDSEASLQAIIKADKERHGLGV